MAVLSIKIGAVVGVFGGGSAIINYELWIDGGSLTSSFSKVTTYVYSVDGFSATVNSAANNLTTGDIYRFIFRSENAIGYSSFSDSIRIALGPLPSQPTAPFRSITGNSATSIGVEWTALTG